MEPQYVAAFIGPACTALFAAVGIAVKSLLAKRRSHDFREREMRAAGETVTFIASYLAAYEKLDVSRPEQATVNARAMGDLEASYQIMMAAARNEHESDATPDWSRVVKATFLIPLSRPAAKVVRAFYYCALVYALGVSAFYMSYLFTSSEARESAFVSLVTVIILTPFNLLPAFLLHMWARRLERGVEPKAKDLPVGIPVPSWPSPTGDPLTPPPAA